MRHWIWVVVALGSIWGAVAIISMAAPDVVYGANGENTFPLVPLVTWAWGAAATGFVLAALVQRHPRPEDQIRAWAAIALTSAIIWAAVTFVALVVPEFTIDIAENMFVIPLGALVAPAAGVVATAIAMQYVPELTDVAPKN